MKIVWYALARLGDPNDDEELSALARTYRSVGPWLGAVWQFTGSAGVCALAGYLVDRFFGVGPWGLLIGSLGGRAVGFWAFIVATN